MHKVMMHDGRMVECYGEVKEDSNFSVVCDNEEDDDIWCEGHPDNETGIFADWEDVVAALSDHFSSDIIEITAV